MDIKTIKAGLEYDLKTLKAMNYEDTTHIEKAIEYLGTLIKPAPKRTLDHCPFCFKKDCDTTCGNPEKF